MPAAAKMGRMRHYVAIERRDLTPTDDGATADTAVVVCRCWASIEPLSGREAWIAREQQATTTHRIRMHYRAGITPAMRAVWAGRTFEFTTVVNVDELNRELEIMATEVLS